MMGIILATAGHVDHGKTTLIKKLTGIDTDTTEEEKKRLDEAQILEDVSHMPARTKCAVLGWHTMEEMLKNGKQ